MSLLSMFGWRKRESLQVTHKAFWSAVLPLLTAILPTALSVGSQFLPKPKNTNESGGETVETMPDYQRKLIEQLSDWASTNLTKFNPGEAYSGKYTASASPFEKTGMDILSKYLSGPGTGGLFGQAEKQVSDTLFGKYADPNTSPFIQAMSKLSSKNYKELIDKARARAGSRGAYYTTKSMEEESKIGGNVMDQLNALIEQFSQNERQNMLNSVSTAANLDKYKNIDIPGSKLSAAFGYGALPRTLEQADLEAQYNDYKRQRTEMALPLRTAMGVSGLNISPNMVSPIQQTDSPLTKIMQMAGGLNWAGTQQPGASASNFWNLFS